MYEYEAKETYFLRYFSLTVIPLLPPPPLIMKEVCEGFTLSFFKQSCLFFACIFDSLVYQKWETNISPFFGFPHPLFIIVDNIAM